MKIVSVRAERAGRCYALGHNPKSHDYRHNAKVSKTLKANTSFVKNLVTRNKSLAMRKCVSIGNKRCWKCCLDRREVLATRNRSLHQRRLTSIGMKRYVKAHSEEVAARLASSADARRRSRN